MNSAFSLAALRTKGKLEPADLTNIMMTQVQMDTSIKSFTHVFEDLREYPREYKQLQRKIIEMRGNFDRLMEIVEKKQPK